MFGGFATHFGSFRSVATHIEDSLILLRVPRSVFCGSPQVSFRGSCSVLGVLATRIGVPTVEVPAVYLKFSHIGVSSWNIAEKIAAFFCN